MKQRKTDMDKLSEMKILFIYLFFTVGSALFLKVYILIKYL